MIVGGGNVLGCVYVFVYVGQHVYCKINQPILWKPGVMTGPTKGKN